MRTEFFIRSIESNLTPLAPVVIPGIIKKQLEQLNATRQDMSPVQAKQFIDRVAEALVLFIGPDGSNSAKKLMMKKLRECCNDAEIEALFGEAIWVGLRPKKYLNPNPSVPPVAPNIHGLSGGIAIALPQSPLYIVAIG